MPPPALRHGTLIALFAVGVGACGGGAPLLHPAQVLPKGHVSVGAGLSGHPVLRALPSTAQTTDGVTAARYEKLVQDELVAPAVAPWVGARIGLTGADEAGITFTGRSLRLDGRHAFTLSKTVALSLGLGGELLGLRRVGADGVPQTFSNGGFDVPLLLGWMSTGGLYAVWIGPRAGVTWINTDRQLDTAKPPAPYLARDLRLGAVAGLRLGFRHVHVALEIAGDWHDVTATLGDYAVSFGQISLTPAGALLFSF